MIKKLKNIIKVIVLAFMVVLFTAQLYGQQYNTLYWMQGIPQSVYGNPAHQLDARIYIGTPGASSIYAGYGNSGFAPSDILKMDMAGNLYWTEDDFLSSINDRNYLYADAQVEILTFGFRIRDKNYFHFNFSEKAGLEYGYPGDLFYLALKGNNYFIENSTTGTADFGGLGFNGIHYSEFGIGYSRILSDVLDIGGRVKFLFGHSNVNMLANDLRFVTDPDTYALSFYSDVTINSSAPVTLGAIDPISDENDDENGYDEEFDPLAYALNFNNFGLAFDLGAVYEYDDNFTFAVSIADLGYIKWKSGVENNRIKGDLEFDGIDAGNLFALAGFVEAFDDNGEDLDDEIIEDPFDDILEDLKFSYTQNPYSIMLSPKIYVSAKYSISNMHSISFLSRSIIAQGQIHPSFSLVYNIQPIKAIGFSLSYGVFHGKFNNLGFGTHLNLYPFQLYIVTDNFLPALQPHNTQMFNIHLGINWVIGYRQKTDPVKPSHSWGF